jgi:membrane associated rhomboid family serine protease
MIPIGTDVPALRRPVVTIAILGVLGLVWVFYQAAGLVPVTLVASVCELGLVPGELTRQAPVGLAVPVAPGMWCVVDRDPINIWTPLTSMFLHGSWGHLLGNGLFLWVFGKSIEDSLGRIRFPLFYLLCGLAGAAAQVAVSPGSPVPMVGASGAIAGLLGGFLLLYPGARVRILFVFIIFVQVLSLPAGFVLLWWIGWQLLAGLPQLTSVRPEISSGVAVWAHVGGFVAGAGLVRLFVNRALYSAHQLPRR